MKIIMSHFNSIKVRLEPLPNELTALGSLFQFHKGTIRTKYAESRESAADDFNSIKVRLELILLIL